MMYLLVYAWGVVFSLALTPLIIRLARRGNLMDHPGPRKVHGMPVPRVGGLAIATAALSAAIVPAMSGGQLWQEVLRHRRPLTVALGATLGVFAIGLLDDVRPVPARLKLLGQLLAAGACCAMGLRIQSLRCGTQTLLELGVLSWPVTVLWIVGITNALNLIDGLDGLAAGIAAAACGAMALCSLYCGQWALAGLLLAVAGSLTGFLRYNSYRARIFLGDSGTYFLGFLLGISGVMLSERACTVRGLGLPILALGLPIYDILSTMLRRLLARRSLMSPDRGHIHHRLLASGMSHPVAVRTLHAITVGAAGMGCLMIPLRGAWSVPVFLGVLGLLALALRRATGSLRVRAGISALRKFLGFVRQSRRDRRAFETARLHLSEAASFEQWWREVCAAMESLGAQHLWLWLRDRSGRRRILLWSRGRRRPSYDGALRVNVPIRDRRGGAALHGHLEIPVGVSLEDAGRKACLFTRLMDEHGLDRLPRPAGEGDRAWIRPAAVRRVARPRQARVPRARGA